MFFDLLSSLNVLKINMLSHLELYRFETICLSASLNVRIVIAFKSCLCEVDLSKFLIVSYTNNIVNFVNFFSIS